MDLLLKEEKGFLKHKKLSKSAGPLLILKGCYYQVEPFIHELFSLIVNCGAIPETWLLADQTNSQKGRLYESWQL
jgi:hypothetical protein